MMTSISSRQTEYLFKILVIGEASTGKTSFIKRYVHQFFSNAYKATIGVDFALKTIQYDDNTVIRLQLWDIAGQERFGSMTRVYYKDAVGAFIVFDVNKPKTFDSVMKWKTDLDAKVSLSNGSAVPCLLLANKCDLIRKAESDMEALEKFASDNGFIGCIYTSSKLDINIEKAASLLVREILRRRSVLTNYDDNHESSIMAEQLNRASKAKRYERGSCCG